MSARLQAVEPVEMLRRKGGRVARLEMAGPTTLRMPRALRDHLERCAQANFRSLGAEISARLADSVEGESFDEHGVMVRILRRPGK